MVELETLMLGLMFSWSTSVADIYLDNSWYTPYMHMNRVVEYTMGHKNEANFNSHGDSTRLKYNVQQ